MYKTKPNKMKKSLTEELIDKEILSIHYALRAYFDQLSGKVKMEDRVKFFARVVKGNYNLHKLVKEYKTDKKGQHYLNGLNNTLIATICFINSGDQIHVPTLLKLKTATEEEIIDELISVIQKKVLPEFLF
jgi:hypothetical protein